MDRERFKGLVLLGDRRAELKEFPVPEPGPGQVLMRVRAAGICGSDLHFYRSTPEELGVRRGVVIGHEPSGVVETVGPGVSYLRPGDRIAVNHTLGCGHCEYCLAGETVLCAENIGIAAAGSGGDAEYTLLPASNCFRLPDELSFIEGAFLGCTGATAYNALRKLAPSGRDTLAIFGLGPVGLSAVMVGKALGATVVGIDLIPQRLVLAKDLGADTVINITETDPLAAIRTLNNGRGVEAALETSGSPVAQSQAVDVLRPRGKAAFVGLGKGQKSINPEQFMHKEATLFGSKVMPSGTYGEMTRFMVEKNVRFETIVTHRVALQHGADAFARFDAGAAGKFVIEFSEGAS
jgi:propanol-preferring alcohol dehydrogenase